VRIQNMIDRMLELSIVENRESIQQTESISGKILFEEIVDAVSVVALEKQITLSIQCDSSLTITGERFLLRQSVLNLVQNAMDFSTVGGTIVVSAESIDGSISIVVIDEGSGIPEYAKDRLFERFYSLGRPDTHQRSSGIGLSFVKESIELHGGTVSVKNRDSGVGAIAEIRIPERK